MFLTQSNQIRGLKKEEYVVLRELCHIAKNLYNVGLYNIRQHYFAESKFLRYESNYHACKNNENYKLLQAGISQQTLKVVDRSFRSFFNLIQKCKAGEYRYNDVKLPRYLPKDGYFPLILSTNAITIRNGYFVIPLSREYRKAHPEIGEIKIPFPERLRGKIIKEVRILPCFGAKFFKIQYVYEAEQEIKQLNNTKFMSIDFGLENLATCVTTDGASFIIDGRKLKSINRLYNKEKARLQSIADKQGKKYTERISRITEKRNNRVTDYMKKTARIIIDYCLEQQIGTIVIGYNLDFKRNINIGKRNNQNFVQIPLGKLREYLKNLCERYGIRYIEQEESYTSKASFFDGDEIPEYNADNPKEYKFSGKRIKRGLYRAKSGKLINADVNGAYNILRKSNLVDLSDLQARGCLDHPQRIRIA